MQKEYKVLACLNILALLFYLFHWQWTRWTVEDAFIYARIVRNFRDYTVLSYNLAPIASAATSCLFALAAGLLAKVGFDPLAAAKILGIAATLLTSWVLFTAAGSLVGNRLALLPAAVFLFWPYIVSYTVSGLETPVYMLLCTSALCSVIVRRYRLALICAALTTVFRPDGLLVLLVVYPAVWWFTRNLRMLVRWTIPVAAILAVYYGAHYLYFGALLPHTVTAKGQLYHTEPFANFRYYLYFIILNRRSLAGLHLLALVGAVIGVVRWPRTVWLLIWYLLYYGLFMWRAPIFEWYVVPPFAVTTFFAGIALAVVVEQIVTRWPRSWPQSARAAVSWLPLLGIVLLAFRLDYSNALDRLLQAQEDEATSGAVGQWLYRNTQPDALVFTETLGYIGYYSRNPFVDYPGLVTPDVPAIIKNLDVGQAYAYVIETKLPVYVALRSYEWVRMPLATRQRYSIVARFPSSLGPDWSFLVARRDG